MTRTDGNGPCLPRSPPQADIRPHGGFLLWVLHSGFLCAAQGVGNRAGKAEEEQSQEAGHLCVPTAWRWPMTSAGGLAEGEACEGETGVEEVESGWPPFRSGAVSDSPREQGGLRAALSAWIGRTGRERPGVAAGRGGHADREPRPGQGVERPVMRTPVGRRRAWMPSCSWGPAPGWERPREGEPGRDGRCRVVVLSAGELWGTRRWGWREQPAQTAPTLRR